MIKVAPVTDRGYETSRLPQFRDNSLTDSSLPYTTCKSPKCACCFPLMLRCSVRVTKTGIKALRDLCTVVSVLRNSVQFIT
jgi:hypothetical protein